MSLLASAAGTTLSRTPPVGIEASVFEVEPNVLSGNAPETLASRSILLSRLHFGEKSRYLQSGFEGPSLISRTA